MALCLDSTSKSIQGVLGGAANATNPTYICTYGNIDENGNFLGIAASDGSFNDTTEVTLVSAPDGTSVSRRIVKWFCVYNADDTAVTLHLYYSNSSNDRYIWKGTLQPGYTFCYNEKGMVYAVDTAGRNLQGPTLDGVAVGSTSALTELTVDNIKIDGNTITSEDTDGNIVLTPDGSGTVTVSSNLTMADGKNIVANNTTGTKIGTASTEKLSFYGETPIVRPAGAGYNNWAAFTDIKDALIAIGLIEA